ncbi:hypothetical protein JRQ81_012899 [Phrynocephalus forsythii]|uniref:RRM domain-containing protein n=1 Tax=Phrynocephalus forsythii TaxID=171643 RepID=A0A9Q0Y338_9SAUR|nr:hypothetical protein JRQ81_012899 [Phrynocephalus forsythii]
MAVVIRLKGLPIVAGSVDIRRFFSRLNIPDGGVHIIGGEKGEAFIIFATDEDARQAMSYSGGFIKGSSIELFLSSKTEMQNIIEINRKRLDHGGRETVTVSRRTGSHYPGAPGVGSLSNLVAALKKGMGKYSYDSEDVSQGKFLASDSQNSSQEISQESCHQRRREPCNPDSLYLYIRGMPYSSTEEDVVNFFSGLQIEGVRMIKKNGQNSGDGVVKFATSDDALKGLQYDTGLKFIEVYHSSEGAWIKSGGKVKQHIDNISTEQFAHNLNTESSSSHTEYTKKDPTYLSPGRDTHSKSARRGLTRSHSRSPSRTVMAPTRSRSRSPSRKISARIHSQSPPRKITAQTRSPSPSRRVTARTHSRSPPRRITARTHSRSPPKKILVQTHSRSSPKRVTRRSHSPFSGSTHSLSSHNRAYYVNVQNLSPSVQKDDLRLFFGELDLSDDQIIFLKPHSDRGKDAIVIFKSRRVYENALDCHKCRLHQQTVFLFPVPETKAFQLMRYSKTTGSPERHDHKRRGNDPEQHSSPYTYVYVRNFPYDVTNVEVQKFFAGFSIDDRDIHLLHDDKGSGLGEALVKFKSEVEARKAESLNRKRFLGTEVLLRCISEQQMLEFDINVPSVVKKKMQGHLHSYEKGSQGPSTQGNLKHPSDYKHLAGDLKCPTDHRHLTDDSKSSSEYRHPSDYVICSPDGFRSHPTFTGFGESIPGTFPDRHFAPDPNFMGGSDHIAVIKLKNIPFHASRNEILDFFHGYKIIPESLSLQQNEYDMFSGEALIALINYNEAVAAINELNDRPIGKRKIRLTFI